MRGHGRPGIRLPERRDHRRSAATPRRRAWSLASLLVVAVASLNAARADENLAAMRGDAQLADVAFVDVEHGWAVGDRGTICATADGGEHWRLQESGVECRLAAVQFLDAHTGWAAGGWTEPYTGASRGVLLSTRDGGDHWSHDRKLILPALRAVRFFDRNHGWAIGAATPLFPVSVFTTEDGGRSWTALPARDEANWTTGDFVDSLSGALAGARGALATVRRRGIEHSRFSEESLRDWRRVKAIEGGRLWAVGDGAWISTSQDLGQSWQAPAGSPNGAYRDHFDFHALAVQNASCWIAGAPGTRVLHSADGGRAWDAQSTGVSTPIRGLSFVDDQRGWAVGDLGLILATRDGGRNWRRQRSVATRAALWCCFSAASQLPLECVARLSADEGYLSVVDVLGRHDLDGAASPSDAADRLHEAVVAAGGSAGSLSWRFPLRQSELRMSRAQTIEGWNRANDGAGLERLEGLLVARIRQWRPAVIVTAHSPDDDAQQLIAETLLRAVERAGDATWFTDQITLAGLAPWKPLRVVASLPSGEMGPVVVTPSQVASRLGRSYAALAAPGRSLLGSGPPPAAIGFLSRSAGADHGGDRAMAVDEPAIQVGVIAVGGEPPRQDFFSGIALAPGGEARRLLPEGAPRDLDALKKSAQTRRNLDALFSRAEAADNDAGWLASSSTILRTLEPSAAAAVLDRLAERYHHRGQWQSAAEARELLVDRYPNEPLAAASLAWLVQYYGSGEAQHRARRGQGLTAQSVAAAPPAAAGSEVIRAAAQESLREPAAAPAKPTTAGAATGRARARESSAGPSIEDREPVGSAIAGQRPEAWPARAAEFGKQLELASPSLYAEPFVRFPLATAHRGLGLPKQAERYYLGLARTRPHDAWWQCAQGESWLAEPRGSPDKNVWLCRRAVGRPKLDGQLDDPTWRGAAPVELRSALHDDTDWPTVAMLAYDEEFLYVAASCRAPPSPTPAERGADVPPSGVPPSGVNPGERASEAKTPRPRDADLASRDRFELLIDLDRDWTTYYRLIVDHRGWTREDCWGDASWNPRWYVAHSDGPGAWTFEAAIPLAELTGVRPGPKSVWAGGAQRIAPGAGFQSWSRPASIAGRGEGFGYLIFE